MTLTPQDQRRIIEKESAWVDNAFGQVDLSAFPSLNEAPPDVKHDDRFAKHWDDTSLNRSAQALRHFVSDPDEAAMLRVGEETGNPEFLHETRELKAQRAVREFKRTCPGYVMCEENYNKIIQTLAHNTLSAEDQLGTIDEQVDALIDAQLLTKENLIACYRALEREGLLLVPLGQTRNLDGAEKLTVMRLAQSGRIDEAIEKFLSCALDDDQPSIDILTQPAYRGACDTAVLYVWEVATPDYTPTAEHRAFIQRYCAGRPMTIQLLQSAWAACQENERRSQRGELLSQWQQPEEEAPPTQKEIDALDDDAVDKLYHQSLAAYSAQVRRSSGMLV